ncbi:zinc finger BED domain-containing protein 4-like [Pagrus major]|uniref:zinc finger BED domain-containing protein 4-like n=1 Tax=Pagrus major TaxID=143350 RepID=UPI003CC8C5FB
MRGRGHRSNSQQPPRREQLRQRRAANQEILTAKKQLLKMITLTLQPLEITEDANFPYFVKVLNPDLHVPSTSEMRSLFLSIYTEKENKLQKILNSVDDIVLTCELWSAKAEDYLTVGSHFVDIHGNLQSYVLKTVCLFGDTSAANIQKQLSAVMEEWNMTGKVHSVIRAGVPQLKTVRTKFRQMPCFADTLNVVFKDLMTGDELSNVLKKCQNIVMFFKKDAGAERRLREIQDRLQMNQDELTWNYGDRWLPSLQMLQRLTQQYECMEMVLGVRGKIDLLLNKNDQERIRKIMSALEPLNEATSSMKKQGFQSISAMLPLLRSLMDKLEEEARNNEVARKLLSKCQTEFGDVTNHKLAPITFLDPRFKEQLGEQNKKEAWAKIQKELGAASSSSSAAAEVKELLGRYEAYSPTAEDSNPLAWWRHTGKNKFGELSRLALKKLGVVSTAVPLERAFSSAADRFCNLRSSIEPENLHMVLFLHSYWSSKP